MTRAPASTLATSATRTAATVGAARPMAAARSSSSRPASSSARVWRTTMNIDIRPTTTAPKAVACQVTCPPTVLSARAGPAIETSAGVGPHARGGGVELGLGGVEALHAARAWDQ